MVDSRTRLHRLVLALLLGVLLVSTGGCASVSTGLATPTEPAHVTGGSVQDQLALLAASAEPPPTAVAPATQASATRATQASATPTVRATRTPRPTRTPADGLLTVALAKLPPQARETIRLIQKGGPFPYKRDGVTFENREGLLPKRPSGYYKEYTVVTPGSADRGARRVIAGEGGELYYTDDHYDTFRRVLLP